MDESLKSIGAVTLFVDHPQRSKEFYARVFGVDVVHEDDNSVAFRFDNLVLNLLKRGVAVTELLAPVQPVESGASFLTVWVDDTDAVCAVSPIVVSRSPPAHRIGRGDCARRRSPTRIVTLKH